jgi:membrane-associated protease RseP (regulator of RpoE activity)
MTDETPQPEGEPSAATPEEAPTAETRPFAYDDGAAQHSAPLRDEDDVAPTAAAPSGAAAPVTSDRPAGIFVPKWVGLVAAAIVAALIFGGIGYAIGDASSDSGSTQNASNAFPNGGQLPGGATLPNGGTLPNGREFPGNGNGNGNGDSNGNGAADSNAGFLGVGVQTSTDNKGVEITDVAENSPAAKAGLKTGDVITAIDGDTVTSAGALRSEVQAKKSGDDISVAYTRDGESNTVKVTLTSRSQAQSS